MNNKLIYDFNTAIGDSIKERYESLVEMVESVHRRHPIDYIVAMNRFISSILEVSCEFEPLGMHTKEYNGKKMFLIGNLILGKDRVAYWTMENDSYQRNAEIVNSCFYLHTRDGQFIIEVKNMVC